MPISPYQQQQKHQLRTKALLLYQQGLSLREVGKIVNRSHEWVRQAVQLLTRQPNDNGRDLTKTDEGL